MFRIRLNNLLQDTIFALFFIFFSINLRAQDVCFTQFNSSKLYLNPAFAGLEEYPELHTNYRNQWPDLKASFVSYSVSYNQPVKFLHGGLGFYLLNDVQAKGMLNTLNANALYSYKLKITKYSFIRAGFQFSYAQRSISIDKMHFEDMYNSNNKEFNYTTTEIFQNRKTGYIDFSSGILWNIWDYKSDAYFYAGFSAHHLTQPYVNSQYQLPRKYNAYLSLNMPLSYNRFGRQHIRINPSVIFQKQGNFELLSYSSLFLIKNIGVGTGVKHNLNFKFTTLFLMVGIIQDSYNLIYSYDFMPSKNDIVLSTLGGHEVTFLLKLEYKPRRKY